MCEWVRTWAPYTTCSVLKRTVPYESKITEYWKQGLGAYKVYQDCLFEQIAFKFYCFHPRYNGNEIYSTIDTRPRDLLTTDLLPNWLLNPRNNVCNTNTVLEKNRDHEMCIAPWNSYEWEYVLNLAFHWLWNQMHILFIIKKPIEYDFETTLTIQQKRGSALHSLWCKIQSTVLEIWTRRAHTRGREVVGGVGWGGEYIKSHCLTYSIIKRSWNQYCIWHFSRS